MPVDVFDMFVDCLFDLLIGSRRALVFNDKGFRHFTFTFGIDTNDDAVINVLVGEKMGLEFSRSDLVTLDLNQPEVWLARSSSV